jgi:hypothetical protein
MTKGEERKLRLAETNIDLAFSQIKCFWLKVWSSFKLEVRHQKNSMMYGKRQKNKWDRWWYEGVWWFKILIIYFALEGFTYWLTGR